MSDSRRSSASAAASNGKLRKVFVDVGAFPVVTVVLIIINCCIYYEFLLDFPIFKPWNACLGLYQVFYNQEYKRIFLSSFVHLSYAHLLFNMLSLLWKGMRLEVRYGYVGFTLLIALLSILTGIVHLLLKKIAADLFDSAYITQCSAGISAVLFALKTIASREATEEYDRVFGKCAVPARYAAWSELFLIQMFSPYASFNGHLAGIIVGWIIIFTPVQRLLQYIRDVFIGNRRTTICTPSQSSVVSEPRSKDGSSKHGSSKDGSRASSTKSANNGDKKFGAKLKHTGSSTNMEVISTQGRDSTKAQSETSVNSNNSASVSGVSVMNEAELLKLKER